MGAPSMPRQEQRARRRPNASRRGLLVVAASVVLAAPIGFLSLPASSGAALERRQFLAAAGAGLLAAASSPEAAHADLFEQSSFSGGVRNNPTAKRPEANVKAELAKSGGDIGRLTNLRGACIEAPDEGYTVQLPPGRLIVWDSDACGEGKAFIHAAGRQNGFKPMSAKDGGPARHVFKSARFDNDEIMDTYKAQLGQCFEIPKGGEDEMSWEVASISRGGKC